MTAKQKGNDLYSFRPEPQNLPFARDYELVRSHEFVAQAHQFTRG
ncbi:hypothetical protein [Haladaptatus sp. NG-WS-4]